jgi:hypothetical protein
VCVRVRVCVWGGLFYFLFSPFYFRLPSSLFTFSFESSFCVCVVFFYSFFPFLLLPSIISFPFLLWAIILCVCVCACACACACAGGCVCVWVCVIFRFDFLFFSFYFCLPSSLFLFSFESSYDVCVFLCTAEYPSSRHPSSYLPFAECILTDCKYTGFFI